MAFLTALFMIPGFMVYFAGGTGCCLKNLEKEAHSFGLAVLMQSSSVYLVSPLIISSACVFSSLAD